ncbi:MAG: alpha/beta hydrolase [Anaerovoracaceae bacterium]
MLDPEVAEFYGEKIKNKAFMPESLNYKDMRADADEVFNDETEIIPIYKSEDRTIEMPPLDKETAARMLSNAGYQRRYADHILKDSVPPVDVRIFTPGEGSGYPVMIYFHGGGFVVHNIASHDSACRKIATDLQCIVVSVAYRLAPEDRYPAAISDAFTVLRWVKENAESFGGDPDRVMTGGDSSGAGISASLCRLMTVCGGPEIKAQLLFYGTYGSIPDNRSESVKKYGTGDFVLPRKELDYFTNLYMPLGRSAHDKQNDPFLHPGLGSMPKGMPYTIDVVAECDPLHDDGEAYAKALRIGGNKVELIQADGMMHGFLLYWYVFSAVPKYLEIAAGLLDAQGLYGPKNK